MAGVTLRSDGKPTMGRQPRAALAMRLAGASYLEIADTIGYADETYARQAVERELAVHSDGDEDSRRVLRAEVSARLERLLRSVWVKATDPSSPEHLPAVRMALSLVDRHARLHGLDAPQEVTVHNPTTREIDRWVAHVLEARKHADVVDAKVIDIIEGTVDAEGQ